MIYFILYKYYVCPLEGRDDEKEETKTKNKKRKKRAKQALQASRYSKYKHHQLILRSYNVEFAEEQTFLLE